MIPFAYVAFETIDRTGTVRDVVEITDNEHYALVSYAPTIAPRQRSTLTGSAQYADVLDTMSVQVLGSSAARCVDQYERLMRIIEQGGQWSDMDAVLPVLIATEVQCSAVGKVAAVILGAPPNQAPAQVSPTFRVPVFGGSAMWIIDVTVTFVRRGLWLGAFETGTITTPATTNPVISQHTFATDQGALNAPAAVANTITQSNLQKPRFLFIASRAYDSVGNTGGGLRLVPTNDLSFPNFTSVSNLASLALGGNITRFNRPSTTNTSFWPTAPIIFNESAATMRPTLWSVFLVARNNSPTVPFLVRAAVQFQHFVYRTRPVVVAPGMTDPQIIPLGIVPVTIENGPSTYDFRFEVAAGNITGNASFDLGHVVFLALDDPCAAVVSMSNTSENIQDRVSAIHRDYGYDRQGTGASGIMQTLTPAPTSRLLQYTQGPHEGDPNITCTGSSFVSMVLATDRTFWRVQNTVTLAAAGAAISTFRRRAFRSPQ